MRKPRTWNQIIKQEGLAGLIAGEDPVVEYAYRSKMFRRK